MMSLRSGIHPCVVWADEPLVPHFILEFIMSDSTNSLSSTVIQPVQLICCEWDETFLSNDNIRIVKASPWGSLSAISLSYN